MREQISQKDCFWYEKPAEEWIEALPLGNGRLGAMVYGRTVEEKIQIDESSFWSGEASNQNNRADSRGLLWKIREALQKGNYEEADLLGHIFVGRKNQYGTNMPVGNLHLRIEGLQNTESGSILSGESISGYMRSLSLEEGIARTSFAAGGISFEREAFLSNPAQTAVFRMQADAPFDLSIWYEGIETKVEITGALPEKEGISAFSLAGDARESLHSNGNCGVHLEGCLALEHDGTCRYENAEIRITGCTTMVVYLDLETNMFLQEPGKLASERAFAAALKGYEELKAEHIADVSVLYERVRLDLGDKERNSLPTDERVRRMAQGERDNDLCRLMFQYGRYLLIASSREDSPLPTHMGGIWNDNIYNNIDCTQDMHIDMNLQMQYWAAAQCGLPECYQPFFRYLKQILIPSGEKTAREVYDADGWTAHVVTNPWGFTSLGWGYNWGVFSLGGAWCAAYVWDYYAYTGDRRWLEEEGFDILAGATAFVADYVFWDEKQGYYMTGPSYSPENMFTAEGKDYFLSLSDTCDVLLVREVLELYRQASDILGRRDPLYDRTEEISAKLPPYKIGKHGQLQEWFYDFEEPIPNHRHTSHLLGLYPFRQIVPERDKELARAVEVSIQRRLENFEITSWGMNMLLGYYARLGKGEDAYVILCETFQRIVKPNMASVMSDADSMWCGTWELDGNTGLTSAMAEFLVQSFGHEVILLPALPKAWKDGEVDGLVLKGGHRIHMSWRDGRPIRVEIMAKTDGKLRIRWENNVWEVSCKAGESIHLQGPQKEALGFPKPPSDGCGKPKGYL